MKKLMNIRKTMLTISSILVCTTQTKALIHKSSNNSNALQNSASISKAKYIDHKINEKIKLNNNSIAMLNISLQQNPIAVLKIRLSAKAVRQALTALPAEKKKKEALKIKTTSQAEKVETTSPAEKQFITKQLEAILQPVEEFFNIIQEYSNMVLPILNESLTNHNLLENSLLIEYFSAKEHIKEFCTKKATSFEQFEILCKELISFFNDLDASFSPEVEREYKNLVKQLKAPKNTTAGA